MAIADRSGLPVAIRIASASPHEVTLVEETIDHGFLAAAPERLIGDRAYDSDGSVAKNLSPASDSCALGGPGRGARSRFHARRISRRGSRVLAHNGPQHRGTVHPATGFTSEPHRGRAT